MAKYNPIMKKLFLILMAILPLFVNAQDMPVPALAPDAAIWGYSVLRPAPGGSKVSVLVIDYQYEDASHFVEKVGLARVKKDGKYGFITPENVMAIKLVSIMPTISIKRAIAK